MRGENQLAGIEIDHRFNADWSLKAHYAYSHNWYGDNQARVTAYNRTTGALTRRADATQDSNLDVHALRVDLTGRHRAGERRTVLRRESRRATLRQFR